RADRRVLAKRRELELELVEPPSVVRVEECDVLAFGEPRAVVARRRRTAVLLLNQVHPPIGLGAHASGAIVRGAVIDHDDLEVENALIGRGAQRGFDERAFVVGGDDARDPASPRGTQKRSASRPTPRPASLATRAAYSTDRSSMGPHSRFCEP